jgi:predicted component of type VI protein secretion system
MFNLQAGPQSLRLHFPSLALSLLTSLPDGSVRLTVKTVSVFANEGVLPCLYYAITDL